MTVVKILPEVALEENVIPRIDLLTALGQLQVKSLCGYRIGEFNEDGVRVSGPEESELIPADWIVLALGTESHQPFSEEFMLSFKEHHVIGDGGMPRKLGDAFFEGFLTGYSV